MRKTLTIALAAVIACGEACAIEALVYRQVSRRTLTDALGKQTSEELHQKLYATRKALRTETDELNVVSIVRLDEMTIYQYDPGRRIFAAASVGELLKKVQAYKDALRSAYPDMPRDKQERLAVVLGKVRPRVRAQVEARDVIICGYPTRKVAFIENGRLRMELWLTDAFESETDATELLKATGEFSDALLRLRERERGFALKSRVHPLLGIHPAVENEVTEIMRVPVPDELFRVPEGYRRVESLEESTRRTDAPAPAGDGAEGEGTPVVPGTGSGLDFVPLPR